MRRLIVLAGTAAAVVLLASIALIAWATRTPEPSAVAEPSVHAVQQESVATMPSVVEPPAPQVVPPNPGPPLKHSTADFGHAAKAEREEVAKIISRPPHRPQRGGAAPVDLFRGLAALKEQIRRCAGPGPSASPTVLLLEFESLEGRVAILNAAVRSRGGASDRSIACAQKELLGREIPVAMAEPGPHFELPFTLPL